MRHIGLMGRVLISFATIALIPNILLYLVIKRKIQPEMIFVVLLIAGFLFAIWIYHGIVQPLAELKQAAERIQEGDLDSAIDVETHDEFSEVLLAFEEMRMRLKASQEEKIKNDTENKELISNIAHDLKTPLTTIRGYAEGILDGIAKGPEKQEKYIRTIYLKATEMDKLIDELNYYAKIETNKIPYQFQHIPVADYFQDCADEIGLDMEGRGIAFRYVNEADTMVEMIADPEQTRKVINNIISNSVKYMDKEEKKLSLRVMDAGDFVEVVITDNGKGIRKTDLPYIFQRFFRADSARNSMKGGSGIGLSIVKKIVEDSGGRIWAQSEEDSGTEIHFVLRKYVKPQTLIGEEENVS